MRLYLNTSWYCVPGEFRPWRIRMTWSQKPSIKTFCIPSHKQSSIPSCPVAWTPIVVTTGRGTSLKPPSFGLLVSLISSTVVSIIRSTNCKNRSINHSFNKLQEPQYQSSIQQTARWWKGQVTILNFAGREVLFSVYVERIFWKREGYLKQECGERTTSIILELELFPLFFVWYKVAITHPYLYNSMKVLVIFLQDNI